MVIELTFSSVADLRRWLEKNSDEAGSPEDYNDWLCEFFDRGNTVAVHGVEWDYWSCWEVL